MIDNEDFEESVFNILNALDEFFQLNKAKPEVILTVLMMYLEARFLSKATDADFDDFIESLHKARNERTYP